MLRVWILIFLVGFLFAEADGKTSRAIVADSATRVVLPRASIIDSNGKTVGFSDSKGRIPALLPGSYPITVRYLGFEPRIVDSSVTDTIFLREDTAELPEYVVKTTRQRLIHILAYVREYSSLTTYTDTVFLFREKMVDFMLVPEGKMRYKGWTNPRVLSSRSYYRFTDSQGLDSVSGESRYHFSWSDWVGVIGASLPSPLENVKVGDYTIGGKYVPSEIWHRDGDKVSVDVNMLADTIARKWVPGISGFFSDRLEFDSFRLHLDYDNVTGNYLKPSDLTFYSYNIESTGRGHNMFRFNKPEEQFYVDTRAEVYILDRETISLKEARKWENLGSLDDIGIFEPLGAPSPDPGVLILVDRVEQVDKGEVRLGLSPDSRYLSSGKGRDNFHVGKRALFLLKDLTGITMFKSRKNFKERWRNFRNERRERNNSRNLPE